MSTAQRVWQTHRIFKCDYCDVTPHLSVRREDRYATVAASIIAAISLRSSAKAVHMGAGKANVRTRAKLKAARNPGIHVLLYGSKHA